MGEGGKIPGKSFRFNGEKMEREQKEEEARLAQISIDQEAVVFAI